MDSSTGFHYNTQSPHHGNSPFANGQGSTSHYQPYVHNGVMDGQNDTFDQRPAPLTNDPAFDILEWHPAYQSCQRYFLDYAQHEPATQALCALINIRLPFQWLSSPILTAAAPPNTNSIQNSSNFTFGGFQSRNSNGNLQSPNRSRDGSRTTPPSFVSLVPYIRRLVVTGFDKHPILHGFFGDDYTRGVLPHLDCERRNYLFAAKHGGWRSCKKQYDTGSGGGGDESVPFMKPLDAVKMEELTAAEKAWSGWLAMEDWMVGPRAPDDASAGGSQGTAREAPAGSQDHDGMGTEEAFTSH